MFLLLLVVVVALLLLALLAGASFAYGLKLAERRHESVRPCLGHSQPCPAHCWNAY